VLARQEIYDAFMSGPDEAVEFFHGYTYSGHPMAAAAGHATLDIMERDGLIARAASLEPVLQDAVHALKATPGIRDIRNFGLAAAVELEPFEGRPGVRGLRVFERGLDEGLLLRFSGDTIAMAPPFIATEDEIGKMCETLGRIIRGVSSPDA
jgi:beta-alanine--pyruvate transaminase